MFSLHPGPEFLTSHPLQTSLEVQVVLLGQVLGVTGLEVALY